MAGCDELLVLEQSPTRRSFLNTDLSALMNCVVVVGGGFDLRVEVSRLSAIQIIIDKHSYAWND